MSDPRTKTCTDPQCFAEEVALPALIAIEKAWRAAHRDGELSPDIWGEGPSRLRLSDLDLDTRLRTHAMYGICPVHGDFSFDWDGLRHEQPPEVARCSATSGGQRCSLRGPTARRLEKGLLPR